MSNLVLLQHFGSGKTMRIFLPQLNRTSIGQSIVIEMLLLDSLSNFASFWKTLPSTSLEKQHSKVNWIISTLHNRSLGQLTTPSFQDCHTVAQWVQMYIIGWNCFFFLRKNLGYFVLDWKLEIKDVKHWLNEIKMLLCVVLQTLLLRHLSRQRTIFVGYTIVIIFVSTTFSNKITLMEPDPRA